MGDRLRRVDDAVRVHPRARLDRLLLVAARVLLPLALAACSRGGGEARGAEGAAAAPSLVRTHGSFQAATRQGKTSKVVDLAPLRADKHLVGLGLLSSLRGEVTVLDGQAFLSLPNQDGSFRTEELGAHQDGAAFMVVASVPRWQSVQLPKNTSLDELPAALEELALGAGLDVEQPLPFLIEGGVGNLTLSVVDGSAFAGDREVSDDALKTASRKTTRASCQGTGVGIFAKGDHPEFLAEGSAVHLHFVEQLTKLAGHVESVDLPSGTSFRLPVARAR